MTDDELRALVARNAQAIDRNAQAIDRNAQAIERNAQIIERNAQAIERNAQIVERNAQAIDRLEKRSEALDRQLSFLGKQVQLLVDSQARDETRLTTLERGLQGLYDVLQTLAREQSERSELIDRQIQALIDERRLS